MNIEYEVQKRIKDSDAPLHNLPYPNPDHLRDCLSRLRQSDDRLTKTVLRQHKGELSYRTIKDGFFIGDQENYLFYPFPDEEDLEKNYYSWWRSALV